MCVLVDKFKAFKLYAAPNHCPDFKHEFMLGRTTIHKNPIQFYLLSK